MTGAHIAVVDDDADVRETVRDYLLRQGFAVSAVDGGAALRALMAERAVDLVVLDVTMPGEDGFSIARALRKAGPIGIIMLTANTDAVDRVVGLELGADDYVGKPFDPRELLARVRAVLRRTEAGTAGPAQLGREVAIGKCLLNLDQRRLYARDGTPVPLTTMEFELLAAFVKHPNRPLSRDQLLDLAHGKDMAPFDRSIDTRITRLRRKVEEDPEYPQAIRTVRGAGYMFCPRAAPALA
jgi:two-component system phosphate regulon response regulator OmpR